MKSYYAFRVRPQMDFKAKDRLEADGYDVIAPRQTKLIKAKNHKRYREVDRPLMPSYLVIGIEGEVNWHKMFVHAKRFRDERIDGHSMRVPYSYGYGDVLSAVVCFNCMPLQIPPDGIDRIHEIARAGQFVPHTSSVNTHKSISVGDSVRHGMLEQTANIDEIANSKCKLLVEMFGSYREVWVDLADVEAA